MEIRSIGRVSFVNKLGDILKHIRIYLFKITVGRRVGIILFFMEIKDTHV